MIINEHPILNLLESSPYECHLIGSRYVGKFTRDSDYDFILITKEEDWNATSEWLESVGFKPTYSEGYGPDDRLLGTNVWTKSDKIYPSVDILPMTKEEATMRLKWFKLMKRLRTDKVGLISKGLKSSEGWPFFWDVLSLWEH